MIESLSNKRIINYTKLKNKKYRDTENLFIIEGKHLVDEALKKNIVKEIFTLENNHNYDNPTIVNFEVMKKLSSLDNPPQVLAVVEKLLNKEVKGNVIILDDIKDPGNLGTIIRSAVAFNYETIILSKTCVDIYNSKVLRASEGMIFNINIIINDLEPILNNLKTNNYIIYGTDVSKGSNPIKEDAKHALIIGSESSGMNNELLKFCDKFLNIKMNSLCESLNAAVSASILMYQLSKE